LVVIKRMWHGWTMRANADAYEALVEAEVLPGIAQVCEGFDGMDALRRELGDETEFVTVTLWKSMDDVRAFFGEEYEAAYVPDEVRKVLSRFDERGVHYEAVREWRR
jgi:heme-degrading monooxygenase HmoA